MAETGILGENQRHEKVDRCRMHGITTKQFYYWQKKVKAMAPDEIKPDRDNEERDVLTPGQPPAFLELRPPVQTLREPVDSCGSYIQGNLLWLP